LPGRLNLPEKSEDKPELLFLKWMEIYFSQKWTGMDKYYRKVQQLWQEAERSGRDLERWREIYLNISYVNPMVDTRDWMELAERLAEPDKPLRLYYILGESFSYLSGIRDLTPLFTGTREEI